MAKENSFRLDNSWIEDGLRKRRSNYSNCIVYETSDPVRLEQLKHTLAYQADLEEHKIYIFDNWTGLRELNKMSGETKTVLMDASGKYGQEISKAGGNETRELREALLRMDFSLKNGRAIFIITNINENEEKNTKLQAALRSWAHDPNITSKESIIILVIADCSKILDEYTKKFVTTIPVGLSTKDERKEVIDYCSDTFGLRQNGEEKEILTRLTSGLDIHQIDSILRESWYLIKKFDPERVKVAKTELIKGTGVLEIVYPEYGFDAVGGYASVKDFFQRNIISVLQNTKRAEQFGVPLPRGILLFGPPGTGKTLFSRSLAKELNIPFLNFNTEDIFSKWLGESGQKMKQTIRIVNQMGLCILYIDEIDRFGMRSGGAGDGASEETKRVFSQLLEWLGNKDREAIIIGTTNVPEYLDPAFLRSGRFDYKIPFLYPGKKARKQILEIHLSLESGMRKRPPFKFSGRDLGLLLDEVVSKTECFNGAELEELTNRIRRSAFNRGTDSIERDDFIEAISHFRVNKERRGQEMEKYLAMAAKFTDDQIFLDELSKDD